MRTRAVIVDGQTTGDLRQIISESLAFNIFSGDDSLNADGHHVPIALFDRPKHLRQITLKLLHTYIGQSGCKSVIGVAEGDPALAAFAIQAALKEKMPFYNYGPENQGEDLAKLVGPEAVPCCVVIPYSASQQQVMEKVGPLLQQVPVSCIVSFVDENPSKIVLSDQDVKLVSICDWSSLKDRTGRYKGLTKEKMDQMACNSQHVATTTI